MVGVTWAQPFGEGHSPAASTEVPQDRAGVGVEA